MNRTVLPRPASYPLVAAAFVLLTATPALAELRLASALSAVPAGVPAVAPENDRHPSAGRVLAASDVGADGARANPAGRLTLAQALQMALERNDQFALSFEQVEQARSALLESRAPLGPSAQLTASQANLTTNLRAQGFPSLPGGQILFPTLNGPFNSFDARLTLSQAVFDPARRHLARASEGQVGEAEHQRLALRDQLLDMVALAYIAAQQTQATLESAQANLALSRELAQLASDQQHNGLATGVDVARAQTRVAQDQFAVTQARSDQAQALLRLKRIIGLGVDDPLALAAPLAYQPRRLPGLAEALQHAMERRQELLVQEARVHAAEEGVLAAESEGMPVVSVSAAVGPSGVTPSQTVYLTRSIGIGVSVPLYTNGLLDAHRGRAKSLVRAAEIARSDTRHQIEEDVQLALVALATAEEQVAVTTTTVSLSDRLLELARDRFKAGVADNLEVLDALTSNTSARSRLIEATAGYSAARVNLDAAMGDVAGLLQLP